MDGNSSVWITLWFSNIQTCNRYTLYLVFITGIHLFSYLHNLPFQNSRLEDKMQNGRKLWNRNAVRISAQEQLHYLVWHVHRCQGNQYPSPSSIIMAIRSFKAFSVHTITLSWFLLITLKFRCQKHSKNVGEKSYFWNILQK